MSPETQAAAARQAAAAPPLSPEVRARLTAALRGAQRPVAHTTALDHRREPVR
jgi:hypothetical protein